MAQAVLTPGVFTSMDNAYLSEVIGKPLSQCLDELTRKKPMDPIEWIAHWLYKFADNEIYMLEKNQFLALCAKILKEIEREKAARARQLALLQGMYDAATGQGGGVMDPAKLGLSGRSGYGSSQTSGKSDMSGPSKSGPSKSGRTGRNKGGDDAGTGTGIATWGINCRLGLICQHPILGDIEPRPPLIYPETPEWWERQNYLVETLYDHEVYSRDNDDIHPKWGKIQHMTYKDFVEPGPWLTDANLRNMQGSMQDMVRMPKQFYKYERPSREGDFFPDPPKKPPKEE